MLHQQPVDPTSTNFQTFPIFAATVLLANALNRHSQMTTLRADLNFYGRLDYLPIYVLGIPVVRSLV